MNYSEIVAVLQQYNRQKTSSQKVESPTSLKDIQRADSVSKDVYRKTLYTALDAIWQAVSENNNDIIQSLAIDSDTIFPQSYHGYNHSGSTAYIQASGLLVDCLTLYGLDNVKEYVSSLHNSLDDLHSAILSQENYDITKIQAIIHEIKALIR